MSSSGRAVEVQVPAFNSGGIAAGKQEQVVAAGAYVVETDQGHETMSPAEFAKRYDWKNDPSKVTMLPESSQQQP
ncbi:MAG TPA: hypothetical protein PLF81_25015, partial [Candidatus Anammoximicrobium sp.]|nr:hypothetical protein [Candidatus Anammoximicrobium sp.]